VKIVHIDLVATGDARSFSFLVLVPGFRADYAVNDVFRREVYPSSDVVDYTDSDAFRKALETLPCCVSNEKGSKTGDPLNLVIVGGLDDAFPALVRRGLASDGGHVVGLGAEDDDLCAEARSLSLRTGEQLVRVRPPPGSGSAEGA
jgi:hypothetical protein